MAIYIVTGTFQFRGAMLHRGQTVKLNDSDVANPFVAAHTKKIDGGADEPAGREAYFGNGRGKKEEEAGPAGDTADDADGMTKEQLKAALGKMGVPCPPKATKEELQSLYAQMREASAGSGMLPNRPGETGE